jgi:uncharacterized protein (TIGR03085 family)
VGAKEVLRAERAALCDTLEQLGPDAPTLCEGWTTADLAAHLVVRERDPRAVPGLVLGGPAARYTAKLQARAKAHGYPWLLERLRSGPPAYIVHTMAWVNVNENWIHHEDARRANGMGPRPEDPEVAAILLGIVRRMGRFVTRGVRHYGVELVLPGGTPIVLRRSDKTVRIHGPVGECILYVSGRRSAAEVRLEGDAEAIEAIQTAKLGL